MVHVYALCTGYIEAGATMFYGHDPAQWAAIPRAPAPVI